VHDVLIFGAGRQAYWHARLALLLRGTDVHHLSIINRTFGRAAALLARLFRTADADVEVPLRAPSKTSIVTPAHAEYAHHLRSLVRGAAALFLTTASPAPLFPAELLTHDEARRKGRYVAAIGAYKPHTCELHPDIVRQAVAPHRGAQHHRHARQGGVVVVDSVEACLREAGELVQAGVGAREVVELGELMLKAEHRKLERMDREESVKSDGIETPGRNKKNEEASSEENDAGLKDWLERGNVIYKSVGLALMVS
jgi:ornithine cyclodeaminase/alanine dehydrogenase-like protein (mu-crystallin family)